MKRNILLAIIISLLVGGGIGYALTDVMNTPAEKAQAPVTMDHSMMGHSMQNMDDMNMETMMMDMTTRMEGETGDKLDKIFLEDMIIHHRGAVDMAIIIKEKTDREELKNFAQEIIDLQDQEINMMNGWLKDWFSN
jgi:uncharacterized protein (DUF305 family)